MTAVSLYPDQQELVDKTRDAMRDKYGSDFYLKPRSRKHRYVTIRGSRGFVARAKSSLRYSIEPYPKGAPKNET